MPELARITLNGTLKNGPDTHLWPLPYWDSFVDIELLRKEWERALATVTSSDPSTVERLAKEFLQTVLRVGTGETEKKATSDQKSPTTWLDIAAQLSHAVSLGKNGSSKRSQAFSTWALCQAGLLAAPEFGLPAKSANDFLDAMRSSFKSTWHQLKHSLTTARRERLDWYYRDEPAGIFEQSELGPKNVEVFLQTIDRQFPEHHFRQRVEHTEDNASESSRVYSNLESALQSIKLPFLSDIFGVVRSPSTLGGYLTPLRKEWLKRAPATMMENAHSKIYSFNSYSDAGASAILQLWKASCSAVEANDLVNAILPAQKRLTIDKRYKKILDQKRIQTAKEASHLTLVQKTHFSVSVHEVIDALRSFLKLPITSRDATRGLEAVLRIAYDHEQDQDQSEGASHKPIPPVSWKGIKVRFQDEQPFYPWTVPNWSTLFEWESMEQNWSSTVQGAHELIADGGSNPDVRIVDALAYFLLSSCHELQLRSNHNDILKLQPSVMDWRNIIISEQKPRDRQDNIVRSWMYSTWQDYLILMAAPESGLSDKASFNILSSLFNTDKPTLPQERLYVNALTLRKPRMVIAGIQEDQVDSILNRIDQANSKHPWVQRFGIWTSVKDDSTP